MKRILPAFLLLFSYVFNAQDTLYFKDSKKVVILLLETGATNIKYKRFDNQGGPTYTVLKNDVAFIAFTDGKRENFENPVAVSPVAVKKDSVITKKDTVVKQNTQLEDKPVVTPGADTIFFKSGKTTEAKIITVQEGEIKYKLYNYQDGPTYQASKSEVKQIVFNTGMVQHFNESAKVSTNEEPARNYGTGLSMYLRGKDDANKYYNPHGGKVITGLASSIPVFGLAIGLVPALVFSNIKPKDNNLNIPFSDYSKNAEYISGYKDWAAVVKRRKIWRTYGVTCFVSTGIVLLLVALSGA